MHNEFIMDSYGLIMDCPVDSYGFPMDSYGLTIVSYRFIMDSQWIHNGFIVLWFHMDA